MDALALLRQKRNQLLVESDFRVLPDFPRQSDQVLEVWKAYRQRLRDITLYSTPSLNPDGSLDMASVAWPDPPQ